MRRRVVELLGRSRADRLAALAVATGLFGIVVAWLARPERGGDTAPLQTGSEALSRCLRGLDLVHCTTEGPIDRSPSCSTSRTSRGTWRASRWTAGRACSLP